jgi:hypothetical protein
MHFYIISKLKRYYFINQFPMSQSVSFDEGFEAPEFHKDGLHKCCINTAKGAKVNGNDTSCTNNCEKLYAECERLSEIAKKKNTIIN